MNADVDMEERRRTGKVNFMTESDGAIAFSLFGGGGYRWGHFEFYSNLKCTWFLFSKEPYEYPIYMNDGSRVMAPVVSRTEEKGKVFQINLGVGYCFRVPE
jgi:hypothetical protein